MPSFIRSQNPGGTFFFDAGGPIAAGRFLLERRAANFGKSITEVRRYIKSPLMPVVLFPDHLHFYPAIVLNQSIVEPGVTCSCTKILVQPLRRQGNRPKRMTESCGSEIFNS